MEEMVSLMETMEIVVSDYNGHIVYFISDEKRQTE